MRKWINIFREIYKIIKYRNKIFFGGSWLTQKQIDSIEVITVEELLKQMKNNKKHSRK